MNQCTPTTNLDDLRMHTRGHTNPVYNYMPWGSFRCQKSEQVCLFEIEENSQFSSTQPLLRPRHAHHTIKPDISCAPRARDRSGVRRAEPHPYRLVPWRGHARPALGTESAARPARPPAAASPETSCVLGAPQGQAPRFSDKSVRNCGKFGTA